MNQDRTVIWTMAVIVMLVLMYAMYAWWSIATTSTLDYVAPVDNTVITPTNDLPQGGKG